MAKRADAKVDDLIKVESELSTTQSQIEELTADQSRLNQRVATEMETVQIAGRVTVGTRVRRSPRSGTKRENFSTAASPMRCNS